MAIIARYSFDVPFGRKSEMLAQEEKWAPIGKELGFPQPQVLVGSIGAPESRVEFNYTFENLSALEAVWNKLGDPRMVEYQRAMAPFIVPGSHRWEILRVHGA
jgi:hypothetical protein